MAKQTVGVVGLGLVWSQLLNIEMKQFIPALTAGLIVWQLFSGVVIESCGLFVACLRLLIFISLWMSAGLSDQSVNSS